MLVLMVNLKPPLSHYFVVFCRVRIEKDSHKILNERILLQPISFTLSVIRNLSSSWYNESPDLDLSGKINSISVSIV